jgi:hypothetical protein
MWSKVPPITRTGQQAGGSRVVVCHRDIHNVRPYAAHIAADGPRSLAAPQSGPDKSGKLAYFKSLAGQFPRMARDQVR